MHSPSPLPAPGNVPWRPFPVLATTLSSISVKAAIYNFAVLVFVSEFLTKLTRLFLGLPTFDSN